MVTIVGVRFKSVGKIYYFDPAGYDLKVGDKVIVETARGMELGSVVIGQREVNEDSVVLPLKGISRMANDEDILMDANNRIREKEAFALCNEKIRKHELDMKLVEVEYTFDRSKILFYFASEDRVDFRELVKDLASVFKTRIELRQIGVRDETKSLGGIGMCGRVLCCHSYLPDFIPVSIKMAKEQNLPLNPTKISGVCGRLMCCLKNEEETYEWLNKQLPNMGDIVETEDGARGEVCAINVLRQKVKVKISNESGETEIKDYTAGQVKVCAKGHRREQQLDKREEAELRALEREERADEKPERREHKRYERQERPDKNTEKPEKNTYGPGKRPDKKPEDKPQAPRPEKFNNHGNKHTDRGPKPDTKPAEGTGHGGKKDHNDRGRHRGNNK